MDAEVSTHTFLTMIIEESVCFMSCEPIFFFGNYSYVVHTEYIFYFFFINQGSQNVPATGDFTGYFWLSAVYKFVKNKNGSW
jgi:hypothetical protein